MNEADSDKIAALGVARRQAWLPFAGAVLITAVIAALVILLASGDIGLVATTLTVTLCLIPLMILLLPLFVGVVLGIWALAGADRAAVERLLAAEKAAHDAKGRVETQGRSIGQKIIGAAAAVERLEPLWRIFDRDGKRKGQRDEPQYPAGL